LDWKYSFTNYTLINVLKLLKNYNFKISEFRNSSLTLFNDNFYNSTIVPSVSDYIIFYSIENTIDPIIPTFNYLINANYINFQNNSIKNKQTKILINILCCLISILFISVEFYFFLINFDKLFIRYYAVFNYIRIFNSNIHKKINIILEIFNDFTEDGLNEIKKKASF